MDYWTIAIYGTNTYVAVDTNSEVPLASLGVSDPMTDVDWLKIKIKGMSKKNIKVDDIKVVVGLIARNPIGSYTQFTPELIPYVFPTDMALLDALDAVLNKDYIYLFKGDYDFPDDNWSIHPDESAICCAVIATTEDDYENGVKNVSFTIRKLKPNPRT